MCRSARAPPSRGVEGAHEPSLLYPFQWQVLKSRCGLHFRPVQRATERRPRNVSQARYDQQQFKNTSPPGGTGMNDTPMTTVQQRKKLARLRRSHRGTPDRDDRHFPDFRQCLRGVHTLCRGGSFLVLAGMSGGFPEGGFRRLVIARSPQRPGPGGRCAGAGGHFRQRFPDDRGDSAGGPGDLAAEPGVARFRCTRDAPVERRNRPAISPPGLTHRGAGRENL